MPAAPTVMELAASYPPGVMLEARVAVKFLAWPMYEVQSVNDFGVCQHTRVATPDRLYSVDWCPVDRAWTKAVGWPQLSRDKTAAGTVAAGLMERGLLDPAADISAHDICLRALEYVLQGE